MKSQAEYQKALGQVITARREKLGFSREKLARITGISIDAILKIEEGSKDTELSDMLYISRVLGMPLSTLLALAEYAVKDDLL